MKYLQVTKVNLSRTLAYPARFFIWMVQTLASFFIFPFIWLAMYQGRDMVAGYSRADIVTYYVLAAVITLLVRAYLHHFVQQDIIRGELNAYLTKPFPYLLYYRFRQLAFKSLAAIFVITFFLLLLGVFPEYITLPKSPLTYVIFSFFLFFSWILSTSIQYIIGLLSFWLGATNGAFQMSEIVDITFSGQIAPLAFFPPLFQSIALFLPFQYMTYIPTQIFLEKLSAPLIVEHTLRLGLWILVLIGVELFLWKKGVKQYDGAGI